MVVSHGPFQTASNLRGSEQFFVDMGENPDFVMLLIQRVTDVMIGLLKNYLSACGPFIDLIELPGDDYATTKGLIFSPRMFRRYIKPALQRLVDVIKNYRADIRVMAHCDGVMAPLLPDLVDVGVDVVHPLEPLPAVDLEAIKRQYGQQISFLGGIDIVHALPGSRDDVVREVQTRVQQLAPGGGYILAPANHVQADVPVENLVTLYQSAREFGVYPILPTS
jgi:uroporphyrinogen decarboxylase